MKTQKTTNGNGSNGKAKHTIPEPGLSVRVTTQIAALRTPFMAFSEGFAQLTVSRADLAPRFIKVFEAWKKETNGTFVLFVHTLDPKMPMERDSYRNHPTYQAADYLRRLQTGTARTREPVPLAERPVTPLLALARLVATVMPAVDPTGNIWDTFVHAMHWTDRQSERIKVLAAKEGAIALPPRTKHTLLRRVA